jgi:MarR family transcriptional regulator, organic hydroperoxide resistance regulator
MKANHLAKRVSDTKKMGSKRRMSSSMSDAPSARAKDLPPSESVGYVVREVHRAFMRSLEFRISQHGITSGMWWFLRLLWIEDGFSQAELSERLRVMSPTTVRAMDRLEKQGLITRQPSADDKRKVHIFLTERGRALRSQLIPIAHEVNRIGTKSLTSAEIKTLLSLLARVMDNLVEDHDAM